MNNREFNNKVARINVLLTELAGMTKKGGLYIEDMDCEGSLYSLSKIEEHDGNVRVQAHMWNPGELAKNTGLWEQDKKNVEYAGQLYPVEIIAKSLPSSVRSLFSSDYECAVANVKEYVNCLH